MTTNMTTTTMEGNRIIAEFMGAQLHPNRANKVWIFSKQPTPYYRNDATYTQFNYDTDWNWLMPVVEKIGSMKELPVIVEISWSLCPGIRIMYVPVRKEHKFFVAGSYANEVFDNLITPTYNAVLEFINWYNTSNRPDGE